MTLALVRRPTCEARSAARKASPSTYTPPWKYTTIRRGLIPSTVISAVRTPPRAASAMLTSAGSGCADNNSRSRRRCSATSLSAGNAPWRRIVSRVSRCSVLTDDLPWLRRPRRRSWVHLQAVTAVEPDRLHEPERNVRGEHVRGCEHAGVLLDDRSGRRVADRVEVALDAGPDVRAALLEVGRRIDGIEGDLRAGLDVDHHQRVVLGKVHDAVVGRVVGAVPRELDPLATDLQGPAVAEGLLRCGSGRVVVPEEEPPGLLVPDP